MTIPASTNTPSAVFIGYATAAEEISTEQRNALQAALDAIGNLPQPELSYAVPMGMVLCFDFPMRTLEFVRRLGAHARRDDWPVPALRIGVHAATVIKKAGASDTTMTTGSMDGAMRVARLAAANQALATPSFQNLAVQLLTQGSEHFRDLGKLIAKNGKPVAAFEIVPFPAHTTQPATRTLSRPGKK